MPLNPIIKKKIRNALRKITTIIQFNKKLLLSNDDHHIIEEHELEYLNISKVLPYLQETLQRTIRIDLYNKQRRIDNKEYILSKTPWYILNPDGYIKNMWDVLMLVLLLYIMYQLPKDLVFTIPLTLSSIIIDNLINSAFIIDVILHFFTFYEEKGIQHYSLKKISHHYVYGKFPFDFFCSFPLEWFLIGSPSSIGNQVGSIKQIFRVIRIINIPDKLTSIFVKLNIHPTYIRLCITLLGLFYMIHFVGCGYWYFVQQEYGGISLCDDGITHCWTNACICNLTQPNIIILNNTDTNWYSAVNPDIWVPNVYTANYDLEHQYLIAFAWGVTCLTSVGINIQPRSKQEYIYSILCIIVCVLFYGILINTISNLMGSFNLIETERLLHLDKIKAYLKKYNIPNYFYNKICDMYTQKWKNEDPIENTDIFNNIPKQMKADLRKSLWKNLIHHYPVLKLLDIDSYYYIIGNLHKLSYMPGEFISHKGDYGDDIYFLYSGKIDAVALDDITVFYTIYPGSYFGEGVLLEQGIARRECSFRAVSYTEIHILNRKFFNNILLNSSEFLKELKIKYNQRLSMMKIDNSTRPRKSMSNTTSSNIFSNVINKKIYLYGNVSISKVVPLNTHESIIVSSPPTPIENQESNIVRTDSQTKLAYNMLFPTG